MVKKLFLTAKVLAFSIFIFVFLGELWTSVSKRNEYSYGDYEIYRNKKNSQPMAEYAHQLTSFEESIIAADKANNFIEYNLHRFERGPMFLFFIFLAVVIFEKWLFWLFKKEPASIKKDRLSS